MSLGRMQGHHRIEDAPDLPLPARAEPRAAQGLALPDADRLALDGHRGAFAAAANGARRARAGGGGGGDATATFLGCLGCLGCLGGLDRPIDRHLTDGEDLAAPVIPWQGEGGPG